MYIYVDIAGCNVSMCQLDDLLYSWQLQLQCKMKSSFYVIKLSIDKYKYRNYVPHGHDVSVVLCWTILLLGKHDHPRFCPFQLSNKMCPHGPCPEVIHDDFLIVGCGDTGDGSRG